MSHKSAKKRKTKSKSYKNKISQKVIQKVVVKIGEERKAKKVRRKYRRTQRASEQEQLINQLQSELVQQRIPPNVIYQTSVPFQAPQQQLNLSEMVAAGKTSKTPQYIEIETQTSEPIYVPTKKEQLEMLQTPVPEVFVNPLRSIEVDPINSKIYTAQALPQEHVEGNFAFGAPDISSKKAPISLVDNEIDIIRSPTPKPASLGEFALNKKATKDFGLSFEQIASEPAAAPAYKTEPETEVEVVEKKKRRTKSQITNERRAELQQLYEARGVSAENAFKLVNEINSSSLDKEIKAMKSYLKKRGKEKGIVSKAYSGAKAAVGEIGTEVLKEAAKGKGVKAKAAEKFLQQPSESESGGSFLGGAAKAVGGAFLDVGKEIGKEAIKGLLFH
jgi:hypothetical protein